MKELVLPWPPKELSPNARMHWAAKSKVTKAYRHACWALAMEAKWPDFDWDGASKVHLFVTFYPPDRRRYDDDNIFARFKSGRDGLSEALGIDDRFFVMHPFLHTVIGGMVKVKLTNEAK